MVIHHFESIKNYSSVFLLFFFWVCLFLFLLLCWNRHAENTSGVPKCTYIYCVVVLKYEVCTIVCFINYLPLLTAGVQSIVIIVKRCCLNATQLMQHCHLGFKICCYNWLLLYLYIWHTYAKTSVCWTLSTMNFNVFFFFFRKIIYLQLLATRRSNCLVPHRL